MCRSLWGDPTWKWQRTASAADASSYFQNVLNLGSRAEDREDHLASLLITFSPSPLFLCSVAAPVVLWAISVESVEAREARRDTMVEGSDARAGSTAEGGEPRPEPMAEGGVPRPGSTTEGGEEWAVDSTHPFSSAER